jgi:hypothetical protein
MRVLIIAAVVSVSMSVTIDAQRGRGGGGGPAVSAKQAAPIDLTGYWVSPVIEDWKFRMVTPNKGEFGGLPLNPAGRKLGESWDPAKDEAAGEQCRAYGAASIMRLPGRLHITWQDDTTLQVETDTGTQTRVFRFGATPPAAGEPTWQGNSLPGYVRKNGAPYSNRATVTEYWEMRTLPNKDQWLTVTTKVDDPVYFTRPYITSSDFKKLPGAAGWNPTPCSAK